MKSKMQKFANVQKKRAANQRKRDFKKVQERRKKKKQTDDDEIQMLSSKLWPDVGEKKEDALPSSISTFADLPISKKTLEGLTSQNYIRPTDVQRESLLYGLKGHDILGAAKTGSGKTLAFLIPILETLFRLRYTPSFGMAALVISPTRELAYQSFDVLKKIGKLHDLSFGLVIGGMHLREEAKKMNTTNVVICTPGRLQQHFEQTPNFTADELKVLVLDEADKILHMGFAEAMNAIVEALPRQRQTLLFSATQTKSVKDLARLSLKRPIYISVHEKAKEVTPTTLDQRYVVCGMHEKVNILWSFIKSHKHKKMLVFLSCCKEVRYLFQVFKKMHPGLTILALHGHMKQNQRMEAYEQFTRKQHVVMLATDVAARGLDFPVVHWVVQVDKPENVDTYIHRVGRTARYDKVGEALLMLLPGEEKKMTEDLAKRKIPIVRLRVSKKRMFDVTKKLESLCAADKDLKENARKGFISVMKTVYVLDKATFQTVDQDAFAASLGLVQTPKLPFLNKKSLKDESDEEDSEDEDVATTPAADKAPKTTLNFGISDDEEEDDKIYQVVKDSKRDIAEGSDEALQIVEEGRWTSKKKSTLRQKLKLLKQSARITFDDEGNPEGKENDASDDESGLNIAKAKLRLKEQDKIDKEAQRQRVKAEHREKRLKEKDKRRQAELAKRGQTEGEEEVVLGNADEEASNDDEDINEENSEDDESDDDGPAPKKRKMESVTNSYRVSEGESESGEDEEDFEDSDEDDDDDDMKSGSEEESDSSEPEEDEDNSHLGHEHIEADEAAVLALLGGNR